MFAIGMMEGAYFVGRVELLNWLNDLLKLDYTKVEQVCSAAALCQIMDAIYPGQIPLHKVNFNAKQEYEYINNFKVLQTVFDKFAIDKFIDVAKLVKGKYQDNLEFLQWLKRYYDIHHPEAEYNAVERRKQAMGGKALAPTSAPKPVAKPTGAATKPAPKTVAAPKPAAAKVPTTTPVTKVKSPGTSSDSGRVQELQQQNAELKLTTDGLEKERDFYFGKLREIEILCQNADQSNEHIQAILRILYATDDQQEFVTEEATPQEEKPVEEQVTEEPQPQNEEDIESF